MPIQPEELDSDFEKWLQDPEVDKSRFGDRLDLDRAIIATRVNSFGVRVFVYDEQKMIDIEAERVLAESDGEVNPEDAPGEAADNLFNRVSDYFHYSKEAGKYAPYILLEALEEPDFYEERGAQFFTAHGVLYVS